MLHIALFAAILSQGGGIHSTQVSLASSEAIDIAGFAAREWAGRLFDTRSATFDLVDPRKDRLEGYISVLYNVLDKPVLDVSINLSTGQVVDRNRCIYFDGAYFKKLRRRFYLLTGSPAVPTRKLALDLGCDRLATR